MKIHSKKKIVCDIKSMLSYGFRGDVDCVGHNSLNLSFDCDNCNKTFTRKDNLKYHQKHKCKGTNYDSSTISALYKKIAEQDRKIEQLVELCDRIKKLVDQ